MQRLIGKFVQFGHFLRQRHIKFSYQPYLWAINRMKRYKPHDNGYQYYSEIFAWIEANIGTGVSEILLKMLTDKYPFDKDAERLHIMGVEL